MLLLKRIRKNINFTDGAHQTDSSIRKSAQITDGEKLFQSS